MEHTDIRSEVVVGVDGSPPSREALHWAAAEARRRAAALVVVSAFSWHRPTARFDGAQELEAHVRKQYEEIVTEAVAEVRAAEPGLSTTGSAVLGNPAEILIEAGRRAALVVVGSRGHGGFSSLLLGAVGQQVATHSTGPVAVVRGRGSEATGKVVVGVESSRVTNVALATAFAAATMRGTGLVAVHAHTPVVPTWGLGNTAVSVGPGPDATREIETTDLRDMLAPWEAKHPQVPVEIVIDRGSAAKLLVDASATAGLVVVGSRGHSALAGTVLGSTSLQLLHHAHCPVVIARPAPVL